MIQHDINLRHDGLQKAGLMVGHVFYLNLLGYLSKMFQFECSNMA